MMQQPTNSTARSIRSKLELGRVKITEVDRSLKKCLCMYCMNIYHWLYCALLLVYVSHRRGDVVLVSLYGYDCITSSHCICMHAWL